MENLNRRETLILLNHKRKMYLIKKAKKKNHGK